MSLGLVGNGNLLTQASSQTAFAANCISTFLSLLSPRLQFKEHSSHRQGHTIS